MALTTSAVVAPAVSNYFDRLLLVRARPKLFHAKVAQRRSMKQRNGNTIKFRRFEDLDIADVPLVEGVTPTGQELSTTDVTAVMKQHGNYVPLTDIVQFTVENPVLNEATTLLAENAADTIDVLHREEYVAGTSVQYGGTAAARSDLTTTTHKVTTALLDRIIRQLNNANAQMFTSIILGQNRENTFPIRPAYWAIIHPDVLFTLENLTGFKSVEEYSSQSQVMDGEVGAYKNLRFLCTTLSKVYAGGGGSASGDVKSTGGNADVYTILAFGKNAVGTVPFDGQSLKTIIKPLGSAGTADPLDQRATAGWKRYGTQVRLNENFMVRGEVTAGNAAP